MPNQQPPFTYDDYTGMDEAVGHEKFLSGLDPTLRGVLAYGAGAADTLSAGGLQRPAPDFTARLRSQNPMGYRAGAMTPLAAMGMMLGPGSTPFIAAPLISGALGAAWNEPDIGGKIERKLSDWHAARPGMEGPPK